MQQITISGNLGRDAELKMIGTKQYAVFPVGVSRKWTDQQGQEQRETTWFQVMRYDGNAKLAPYLTKGKKVVVQGELRAKLNTSQKDGRTYMDLSVWADQMDFMSASDNGTQSGSADIQVRDGQVYEDRSMPSQPAQPAQRPGGGISGKGWGSPAPAASENGMFSDDLPF